MAELQLKNISKYFEDTKVLSDINIDVADGEFVVLVGPSGSGKSTILRLIAGLEDPTNGEIKIDNKAVNDLPPKERDIAMVFQNYALYPHMSVYENLSFPLKMKNMDKSVIDKAVNETSELLGIKKYLGKKPRELSGGEKQRVALGRAIIRKPILFLMDEPLSNLDAKLRTQMRSELLKIHKALATTVIYVTHDQVEALTMGSKIIVLNNGTIQQIGSPHSIYTKPENTFVAGFIGNPAMNFFNFKVINKTSILFLDKVSTVDFPSYIFNLFENRKLINEAMILGIRPEHILIANKANNVISNDQILFDASVDLVEMLGNEYLIHASVLNTIQEISFSIRVFENYKLTRNDKIAVLINLNKASYFNKSGDKITL